MSNFCLKVNGVDCPVPSEFNWSIQVTMKEKIGLKWLGSTPDVASTILTMFNPEYINVTYLCPLTNSVVTKEFYTGDRSAPYYWWCDGGRHTEITFNIIER